MKKKPASDALDRTLTALYQTDIPEDYKASWRDAVKREEPSPMKPNPHLARLRRAALPVAAAAVLIIGTAVTGIIAPKTADPVPAAAPAYDMQKMTTSNTGGIAEDAGYGLVTESLAFDEASADLAPMTSSARSYAGTEDEAAYQAKDGEDTDSRKIVRTVSISISSALFDQDYDAILALADGAGGYASVTSMYTQQVDKRRASLELKIPSENLDSFLTGLGGIGRVTDRYETTTDETLQYTDTALRLKTQQDKMTRLEELLLEAETVEDLLYIESEIADTQYWIDSLQSSLNSIDRQVDYASVSVYLSEQTAGDTAAAQDLTIAERLRSGLQASLKWLGGFFENMLVFLTAAAPVLVPLIAAYIIYRVVRKRRKTKEKS